MPKSKRLEMLISRFGEKSFHNRDVEKLFGWNCRHARRWLCEMVGHGALERAGRGLFIFPSGKPKGRPPIRPTAEGLKIHELLAKEGIFHVVSGMDIVWHYVHMLPFQYPHLVYIEKDAHEWAEDILEKGGLKVIVGPKCLDEIRKALDWADKTPLVLLMSLATRMGARDGFATVERALVDTHFESSRRRYPIPATEVGRYFSNAWLMGRPSVTSMLRYARERKIEEEIIGMLAALSEKFHYLRKGLQKRPRFTPAVKSAAAAIRE